VRAAASSDVKAAPLRSKAAAPAAGSSDASSSSSSSSNKQLSWLRSKWDKDIWQLAVPAALALAADPLLGMVDTALVGRLGSDELVSSVGCFEVLLACRTKIFDSSLQK
jgi:hypothetical protein